VTVGRHRLVGHRHVRLAARGERRCRRRRRRHREQSAQAGRAHAASGALRPQVVQGRRLAEKYVDSRNSERHVIVVVLLVDSAFLHGVKKMFHGTEDVKDLIDPYVIFAFAGQQVSGRRWPRTDDEHETRSTLSVAQVQSKIIYTCSHPEFNQELRLPLKVSDARSLADRLEHVERVV
jgi:hypothetical protein